MWYVVEMLFAQPKTKDAETYVCERCDVLFETPSAIAAYEKGLAWAADYTEDSDALALVGIENVRSLDEPPGDGVEIAGGFLDIDNVWDRLDEIPDRDEIVTIRAEAAPDTKVGEFLDERKRRIWEELWGGEGEGAS